MRDPKYIAAWSDSLTFRIRIEEARPFSDVFDTAAAATHLEDACQQGMREDCKVMRSSTRSLAALRSLPSSALVLLLTPVLTPAKSSQLISQAGAMDPFEAFGRDISKSHKRVRHVPYVPGAGMTATHRAFLSQAGAAVVVTCEPSSTGIESLKLQDMFAQEVAAARQALPMPESVPFVLMRFEEKDAGPSLEEYENAFCASALTDRSVDQAVQLMFGHSVNDV